MCAHGIQFNIFVVAYRIQFQYVTRALYNNVFVYNFLSAYASCGTHAMTDTYDIAYRDIFNIMCVDEFFFLREFQFI